MNPNFETPEESGFLAAAQAFPYPPTPDVARFAARRIFHPAPARRQLARRAALAAALALVGLLFLLAAPGVRAQFAEWIQIGVVRIFQQAVPTPEISAPTPSLDRSPAPTHTYLISLLDLGSETTLEIARRKAGFPVRLPTYPADLESPDKVYLMDMDKPFLILVWLDQTNPTAVRLSLQTFPPGSIAAEKWSPVLVGETSVHGQYAAWVIGPYLLRLKNGDYDFRRLVDGNVLVWQEGDLTYRLESSLKMDEAVRVAESLK